MGDEFETVCGGNCEGVAKREPKANYLFTLGQLAQKYPLCRQCARRLNPSRHIARFGVGPGDGTITYCFRR
jgi:hypothetical protein